MEESNVTNQAPTEMNPVSQTVQHPGPSKKAKMIITGAFILLAVLVGLYFWGRNRVPPEPEYTVEQKVQQINDVVSRTEKQGLPPAETQIDIMKYNAQE